MPEKIFKKWRASIAPQWMTCFIAALLVGLAAHLYKIVNWLPNWDSLVFRYDPQNMLGIGRWFLPVACGLSSFYDLPLLNGALAILYHALGAVCICGMLQVEKKITAALIGGAVVTFPAVTSIMMYGYVADGYGMAFFFAALAAWLLTKEKPRYLPAILLIALSAGIYQAYLTVTVTLVLLKLIDDIVHRGATFGPILKRALGVLLAGVLGVVLYSIVLKVMLGLFSMELLDYQGINNAASLAGINLPASLYVIKETFIHCFFDLSQGINLYVALNILIGALTLGYYVKCILVNKIYKCPLTLALLLLLSGMLIVGAGALAIINSTVDYHNLMRMGYLVFYLLFLILYERGTERTEQRTAVKCWAVLSVAAVLIANLTIIANVSYHKAQMAYEKSYGTLIRIADRIQQTPQAEGCHRILVLGALENSAAYSVTLTPEITGITDGYILRADDEVVGQSVLCSALNDYCGTSYTFISGEEKVALAQREEVQALGSWPAADCLTVIDDILILKLSSEEAPK